MIVRTDVQQKYAAHYCTGYVPLEPAAKNRSGVYKMSKDALMPATWQICSVTSVPQLEIGMNALMRLRPLRYSEPYIDTFRADCVFSCHVLRIYSSEQLTHLDQC